jgi:hypothetical protein
MELRHLDPMCAILWPWHARITGRDVWGTLGPFGNLPRVALWPVFLGWLSSNRRIDLKTSHKATAFRPITLPKNSGRYYCKEIYY